MCPSPQKKNHSTRQEEEEVKSQAEKGNLWQLAIDLKRHEWASESARGEFDFWWP